MEPDTEQVPVTCTKWPKGIQGKIYKNLKQEKKKHMYLVTREMTLYS